MRVSDPRVPALPSLRRAHEFVAHELLVLILSGRFQPGDRLPSERELASSLGVSRPTIRQALGLLASHGLVESRVGSGTFVTAPAESGADRLHGAASATLGEIMEARIVLETAVARAAARRAQVGGEALELLRATVEALERSEDRSTFPERVDVAFHRTVAQLTGNQQLVEVMTPVWQALSTVVAPAAQERWVPDDATRVAAEHRAVFEALRVGDADLGGFAMERHLRAELARLVDEAADGSLPRFFA